MKSTIFASTAIAALVSLVAADGSTQTQSNCWLQLGQYSQGGSFCVQPLSDFTDQNGCSTSENQCLKQYSDCKSQTISSSACLTLMSRCQIIANFCSKYCNTDASGNTPSNCNLATAIAWNGISTIATPAAPSPVSAPVNAAANAPSMDEQDQLPIPQDTAPATPDQAAATPVAPAGNNYNNNNNNNNNNNYQQQQQASTPVVNYQAYTAAPAYTQPVAANSYVAYTPTVGICSIPTAYATPIAGFHAPVVACNDGADYQSKPWKQYNSHYTSTSPVYALGWEAHACTESCTTQYNNCINNYANTFKTYSGSSYSAYKIRRGLPAEKEKRTFWPYYTYGGASSSSFGNTNTGTAPKYTGVGTTVSYGNTNANTQTAPKYVGTGTTVTYGSGSQAAAKDTLSSATAKCYAQYSACWTANQYLTTPKGSCSAGGVYHAPTTQAGYNTYNAGTKSYGSYTETNTYAQAPANRYGGSTTNNYGYWKE